VWNRELLIVFDIRQEGRHLQGGELTAEWGSN
jgi:hypothetical protein